MKLYYGGECPILFLVDHLPTTMKESNQMNITIKSEIDQNTISNDYRKMSSKLIVDEINRLALLGHKIVSITDIEGE